MTLLIPLVFKTSLLLLIALSGYFLAAVTNLSAVVGQIIIGILIGPSFLGLITYTGFISNLPYLVFTFNACKFIALNVMGNYTQLI